MVYICTPVDFVADWEIHGELRRYSALEVCSRECSLLGLTISTASISPDERGLFRRDVSIQQDTRSRDFGTPTLWHRRSLERILRCDFELLVLQFHADNLVV